MEEDLIPVSEVARRLNKNKAHVFKVLDRLRINRSHEKSASARGQRVACIEAIDFRRLEEFFAGFAGDVDDESGVNPGIDSESPGLFYLIQLEPEHDPGRFKLGFATNIEERLRSHRTAAPFSRVLRTWPCKLLWEKTAIECVAQDCERLHTEVFRSESITAIESRCEQFFSLMPKLRAIENQDS